MRWTCYLTKNREKPYRWLQAPYQKCTAMFLWTSLPSFSKSTQREHSIITVEKGISVDQPKTLLPLSNHCFSQTSELDKRRCILSEVVPESAFRYYCDLFNRRSYQNSGFDVFVLDIQIFSSYGDRSQISQMKVTDGWGTICCRHFLDVALVFVTVPNYSQMKVTDGWRPSHHIQQKMTALCCIDWWGSRFSWLDTSYLNMGVKLVMEKTGASHEALKLEYICGVNALG